MLCYASHLLPWHGNIMIQCTLGAHDTKSTQQIFMRDILFFIMHTLNHQLKYYTGARSFLFFFHLCDSTLEPDNIRKNSCFCFRVLFAHYHTDLEVVHFWVPLTLTLSVWLWQTPYRLLLSQFPVENMLLFWGCSLSVIFYGIFWFLSLTTAVIPERAIW